MSNNLSDARKAIEKLNTESSLVVEKCVSLFDRFPQDITEFTSQIEAFMLNKDQDTLTLEMLGPFEQTMLKEHSKAKSQNTPDSTLGKRNTNAYVTPTFSSSKIAKTALPAAAPESTEKKSLEGSFAQVQGTKYANRTVRGQSQLALNGNLGTRGVVAPSKQRPLGMRCRISADEDDFLNMKERYRYMFTTLDERARNLDKHLLALQTDMCAANGIEEGALQPVGVPSQDTVWVCGRIGCEAAEGRINKTSVLLEGSRKESAGRRVKLDLSELQASFSLFPGQIVLVEGVNSSGRKMIAKRVIEGAAKPMLRSAPERLLEFHHGEHFQGGAPLSVVTAAGPFTTSDNMDYQPLQDLLVHVLQSKPDVLILVGPFVDISQPMLASGNVVLTTEDEGGENKTTSHHASYEMVFVEKVVRDCLGQMFNSEEDFGGPLPTHIVLVPSLLDAHHEFVFPQPPFGDRDRVDTEFFAEPLGVLDLPFSKDSDPRKRVHLMPNPCMFRVNEVLFGVNSNDVLFSLSSDEVSQAIEGNRLVRLGGHLLQQQSFAPQFPVQTNTLSQFDLRHSRHWEFKVNPDVLILPSRLAPLAKDVHGSMLVNPGQLTKGIGGGTYAEMSIHPVKEDDLRRAATFNQPLDHNIFARTSLSIVKI